MPRHNSLFYSDGEPATKEAGRLVTSFPHTLTLADGADRLREVLSKRVITPACWLLPAAERSKAKEKGETQGSDLRQGSAFAWSDYLWADMDDGKWTPETFAEAMGNTAYVLYTSANHEKPKNGKTCQRFKVLFPLQKRVYDHGRMAHLLKDLVAALGSDPAGSEVKQKFFPPCRPDGKVIIAKGDQDVITWLQQQRQSDPEAGRVAKGQRNAWLFKEAARLAIAGRDEAGILAALEEARDLKCQDPDDGELSDAVLADMAKRAASRFSSSPYAATFRFYESRYVKIREPLGIFDRASGRLVGWDNGSKFYKTVPDNFVIMDDGKVLDVWQTWLRFSRQHADTVEFAPDQPAREIRATVRDGHPYYIFNTFTGLLAPSETGSCEAFRGLLMDVVCGGNIASCEWLWNYLAYIYQHPADPARRYCYAVALSGKQGTGKGTFFNYFARLFPNAHGETNDIESIMNFNGELAGKIVYFFDEAYSASWRTARRKLKHLITSRDIMINEKFVPKYRLANHCRFFFATNDEHSAPVEPNDRRYVCLDLHDVHRNDGPYFQSVWDELEAGGASRLAWELSKHEIDYNVLGKRPKTKRWADNMVMTRAESDPVASYFYDLLEDDDVVVEDVGTGFWELLKENDGWISKRRLADEVNRHAKDLRLAPVSVKRLTMTLHELFGEKNVVEEARRLPKDDGKKARSVYLGDAARLQAALDRAME